MFSLENKNILSRYRNTNESIRNYLYSNKTVVPIHTDEFSIVFETFTFSRVVRKLKNHLHVYLDYECVRCGNLAKLYSFERNSSKSHNLKPIIKYCKMDFKTTMEIFLYTHFI